MIRTSLLALPLLLGLAATGLAQTPDSGIDPAPFPSAALSQDGAMPAADGVKAPSFQRRSGQSAGGPANELNTGDDRSAENRPLDALAALAAVATGRDLYHGNYCGPGERGAGLPAVDALDEACRRHDACYDAAGMPDCACDASLRREATALAENPSLSRMVRARAASVAESTALMRCRRRDG